VSNQKTHRKERKRGSRRLEQRQGRLTSSTSNCQRAVTFHMSSPIERAAHRQRVEAHHSMKFIYVAIPVLLFALMAFFQQGYLNQITPSKVSNCSTCLEGCKAVCSLSSTRKLSASIGSISFQMIVSAMVLVGMVLYLALTPKPHEKKS